MTDNRLPIIDRIKNIFKRETKCSCSNCSRISDNPLDAISNDFELLEMADRIALKIGVYKDKSTAESARRLFIACVAFLRDWFPKSDFSICGVERLLALALNQVKYESYVDFYFVDTPLDLLFRELETGKHYNTNSDGEIYESESTFIRKYDGLKPADIGGLKPRIDTALSFYQSWLISNDPQTLEISIYECIGVVASLGLSD